MRNINIDKNNVKSIGIMGASFSTGNLGVSALAWSTVYLLKSKWPNAEVFFIGGRTISHDNIVIGEIKVNIKTFPVRYCKNIFVSNHIIKLFVKIISMRIVRLFYKKKVKNNIVSNTAEALLNADLICDITGGDSFSDIYGLFRLLQSFLIKRICQMTNNPFILLPQTYGPFKSLISKHIAKKIINKSDFIYSRDSEGLQAINNILPKKKGLTLLPDVAFCLKATDCKKIALKNEVCEEFLEKFNLFKKAYEIVGINISGLLFNGGYTKDNQFDLNCDYPKLIEKLILQVLENNKLGVIIFPHVSGTYMNPPDMNDVLGESDLYASYSVINKLPLEYQKRVMIVDIPIDQCEIKGLIGVCDFFIGSRMHSTIAALSQCVPTIGLAYSKKFYGVYEMIGVEDCVLDLRIEKEENLLKRVGRLFDDRDSIKETLEKNIPISLNKVERLFDNLNI